MKTKRAPWLGGFEVQAKFTASGDAVASYLVTHGPRDLVCVVPVPCINAQTHADELRKEVDRAGRQARRIAVALALVDQANTRRQAGRRSLEARFARQAAAWLDQVVADNRRFASYSRFVETGVTP